MNATEIQRALADIGWPIAVDGQIGPQTQDAVKDFQRGWALGEELAIDGDPGSRTQAALEQSLQAGGKCGRFFAFREFANDCSDTTWIRVNRVLVRALDRYREGVGPTAILSGYRTEHCNIEVGGATSSQHRHGNASDIVGVLSEDDVKALRLFSGIGVVGATGLVVHGDVRHDGPNTTGGTPDAPTIWYYGIGVANDRRLGEEPGEDKKYSDPGRE